MLGYFTAYNIEFQCCGRLIVLHQLKFHLLNDGRFPFPMHASLRYTTASRSGPRAFICLIWQIQMPYRTLIR